MKAPNRLLIVADFCHPYYIGGAARHVYELACSLERQGVTFQILTRRPSGPYAVEEREPRWEAWMAEGRVIGLSHRRYFSPWAYWGAIRNAQVVNIHHPIMGLMAGLVARVLGRPVIYHFHGPLHREYAAKMRHGGTLAFARLVIQFLVVLTATRILVLSEYMRQQCLTVCPWAGDKIRIEPPCLDIGRFRPPLPGEKLAAREKFGIPPDAAVALTTRRLTARTGVLELVRSWPGVRRCLGNQAWLVVAGKGELEDEVRAGCGEGVLFLGYVAHADLSSLYRAADAYVLPSVDLEGFGYVVLEAMATGVPPAVSASAGGATEFVSRIDPALVFAMDSETSLADALRHALETYPEGKAGRLRQLASGFDLPRLADFYLQIMAELSPSC